MAHPEKANKMIGRVTAMQEYRQQREGRDAQRREPRDGDDLDLTVLVNECWKKASFGYPIQEDLRIPGSVAEMIQAEAQRQPDAPPDEEGLKYKPDKLYAGKPRRFDALREYEKLFKLFEDGQQKVRELGHIHKQEKLYQA